MWNVHSNLFGSSFRVISGALVQSNLLTYFRRNDTAESQIICEVEEGMGGVAAHRDLLTTAQF